MDTPESAAARLVELVGDPGLAIELGARGPRAGARALSRHAPPGGRAGTARAGRRRRSRYLAVSMKVTLPDGNELELEDGATGADAARAIGEGLARAALAIKVERRRCATSTRRWWTASRSRSSPPAAMTRSTCSGTTPRTCSPTAVLELYPGTKISIGPPIEDGFYYDFDFPEGVKISDDDFERIEAKMREHIEGRRALRAHRGPGRRTRIERFEDEGQDYKVELIEDLIANEGVDTVSLYRNGPFTDLCRGPHGPSTKRIKAFKLMSHRRRLLARRLQPPDAHPHLRHGVPLQGGPRRATCEQLEQARARDHRKLGRELGLFMFSRPLARLPFWQPPGTHVWNELTELWRDRERGARLHRGAHADPLRRRALEAVGPLGQVPRPHVLHGRGGAPDGPEAHELPRARPDLQGRAALLPRPADPLRRAGPGAPPRAQRHAPRPAARALASPRTTRHIFCTEDQIEEEVLRCLDFGFYIYDAVRLRAAAGAVHPAGQPPRQRRDVGPRRGRAARRARAPTGSTTSSTRATAPSTAPRSTST